MAVRRALVEPSDLIRSVSRAVRVLETVGQAPHGLTVKQIARRCDLTAATAYHLVRTLAYEGYVARRDDGTYVVGTQIADRYRELLAAVGAPLTVAHALRQVAAGSGLSHYLGSFVGGQVVIVNAAEGPRSPRLEDVIPGFAGGAHATALGKALLATLTHDQRLRYLQEWGMPAYTSTTITEPEALEADLVAGERRGMQVAVSQFRPGVACAAVVVRRHTEPERRIVLAIAMSADRLVDPGHDVRGHLMAAARAIAAATAGADRAPA